MLPRNLSGAAWHWQPPLNLAKVLAVRADRQDPVQAGTGRPHQSAASGPPRQAHCARPHQRVCLGGAADSSTRRHSSVHVDRTTSLQRQESRGTDASIQTILQGLATRSLQCSSQLTLLCTPHRHVIEPTGKPVAMLRTAVLLLLAVGLCAGQIRDVGERQREERETMTLFGRKYSVNYALCVGGSVAVGVATSVGLPYVLGAIGFGPIGVGVGTLAALVQSIIGNVAAGSMFAALQSLAMTGGTPSVAAQALITSALACGCLVRVD